MEQNERRQYFDVYPVAVIGGPILISGDRCSPAHYIKEEQKEFSEDTKLVVNLVAEELRKFKNQPK